MSKLRWLCMMAGSLLLFWCSAQAATHNILLIHGRSDSANEQFGTLTWDQHNYWGGHVPATADGHIYYVQWDADHKYYDDHNWPGGQAVIQDAVNRYCQWTAAKGYQECFVICHSAGCAAFEHFMSNDNYCCNADFFGQVMEAGSAAGGSELASWSWLWPPSQMTIDGSLVPTYARSHFDHSNMKGVVFRGIAGTNNDSADACIGVWPTQWTSNNNPNCSICDVDIFGNVQLECADTAVSLHSACGHSRDASFIDCNSTLSPYNDTNGTYLYHGWWIRDNICNGQNGSGCSWTGPYSPNTQWNSGFRTYHVNHGGTLVNIINEYSYAPYGLCP